MGFLSQFEIDIFLSYRHVSNESQYKWIDIFCDELNARLKEYVGDVAIWRDQEQLRGGDPWRPEVIHALDQAAIFLAIVSRTYFDSNECRKELDRFLGKQKDSQNKRKIFPIFKQPLRAEQELPPEVDCIHGPYNFYRFEAQSTGRFRELVPKAQDSDFWEEFGHLAQDIMLTLEELKGSVYRVSLGNVFISCVSPELSVERERLRSDLQQRGYQIIPEKEYIWNSTNFNSKIITDLENAQLCIHLVTAAPSYEPESDDRAKQQLEFALQVMKRTGRPTPMVWIQPSSMIDTLASKLLDYIKNDLANEGVEYQGGSFENFKTHIFDKLSPIQSPLVRKIALLVEQDDIGHSGYAGLRTLLADKLGCESSPVKFKNTILMDKERCAKTLCDCAQVVIFWANQPEEWISDLFDSQEFKHLSKDKICIYTVGPNTPEKNSFKTIKAHTIMAINDSKELELQAFLKAE